MVLKIRRLREYLAFVLETKGLVGLGLRLETLIRRFDLSGDKMKDVVLQIDQIGKKYKYRPAIITPALVLRRHRKLLNCLCDANLEFALHGHTHKNFRPLDLNEQVNEIRKAKDVFEELRVHACGFRAPYLSWNGHTNQAVQQNNLLWESNETFLWNDLRRSPPSRLRQFMEHAIQTLYNPLDAEASVVIPRLDGQLVSIPIALPDDEILVDRLGIKDSNEISRIWSRILDSTHRRGDIFVLQLHPERFPICRLAMERLLDEALYSKRDVWVTGMEEVAQWWKQKSKFEIAFEAVPHKGYRAHCKCAHRAAILGRNLISPALEAPFYRDYYRIKDREFFVESGDIKPCIGVHPRCSDRLLQFLADEGFPYEVSDCDTHYSLFLSEYQTFGRKDELGLVNRIEASSNPIVRYWLWPDGKKSAFVTTHDLDCVTLTDFLLRLFGR